MDTQHNEDKLFTLKEMESAVKNTFDAVHYHHQHPDTFPAVSEFDCYEKFIPIPATPPTPVSRTAEEILERHLKKCNDLGFLKQSSPDKYNAIIAAINEALNITTNKVDDFLRMHPEFRCLDVIGKFSKVIRTQPEEREERVSEKGCPFDEQLP